MEHLQQNRPYIVVERGNGLFVHVPKSFTDEEILHWANKEKPLGDSLWKIAPITADTPINRVECGGNPNGWHVALTVDGKPFHDHEENTFDVHVTAKGVERKYLNQGEDMVNKDRGLLDAVMDRMTELGSSMARPTQPRIKCEGVGARSLLNTNPATRAALGVFMQQIMRGESQLSAAEREAIAMSVSLMNNAMWCMMAHRATLLELIGGKEKLKEFLNSRRMSVVGSMAVVLNTSPTLPQHLFDRLRAELSDQEVHDIAMVVGAFNMMNMYVESLAAITPPKNDDPAYIEVAKRLASEKGYTA